MKGNRIKSNFNKIKMVFFGTLLTTSVVVSAQSKTFSVDPFDKVIVSPHIGVAFIEGETESVTI
jgi:hypothetical protein